MVYFLEINIFEKGGLYFMKIAYALELVKMRLLVIN